MGVVVNVDILHINHDFIIVAENSCQFLQRDAFGFREDEERPYDPDSCDAYKDLGHMSEKARVENSGC